MIVPLVRNIALAALLATGISSSALAQPPMSMSNGAASPKVVHVNRCDPQLTTVTSPAYVGFRPGFYPGGPYFWPDVYGYRYAQPALVSSNGVLYLDYVNVTSKVMSSIEFGLVANGRLVAEVRDVGKFSPNAEIKHQFGLSPNVFPLQTGLPRCLALRITFEDGTKWRNPHLPALRRALYGSRP